MNNSTFSICFTREKRNHSYNVFASNDADLMLREILDLSLAIEDIDNSKAEDEYMSFEPPFGVKLNQLSFKVISISGVPVLDDDMKDIDALIEIANLCKYIQNYGNSFGELYHFYGDIDDTLDVIKSIETHRIDRQNQSHATYL